MSVCVYLKHEEGEDDEAAQVEGVGERLHQRVFGMAVVPGTGSALWSVVDQVVHRRSLKSKVIIKIPLIMK